MELFMKRTISIFIIVSAVFLSAFAQYSPSSPYLQNPALAIGYTDSCATFWLQTWDNQLGGFFTNIDKYGNVITGWGTNKNMLTQSRNVYAMARAYMLTGDTTYIGFAKKALNWMYAYTWDTANGGWFQEIDINGNPMNPFGDKTAFYQHYGLLGISAYYEATHDTTAWKWLMKGYQHLENFYWDNRSAYLGYYDITNYNGQNARYKSFNATVDAITTHLLYLYLMTKEESYKNRLLEIGEEIKTRFISSMPQQAIGFVEEFDSDWGWNNNAAMTIMGHVLKAGWCLARINQLFPDTSYVNAAEYLINDVWQKGYDHVYGGPYKDFNRVTGQMLLWGLQDSAKAWWQMEQAIVAGLMMYDITHEDWYMQMADETISFFMNYFVDHQYGEVYADRTRRGGFAWNEAKGNSSKAGYHSTETGYYTYLYGNLFYTHQPVILHYNFDPLPFNREILLTPIAINDSHLVISEVKLAGQTYANYNPTTRVLQLPSGIGGHFEITYQPVITRIASDQIEVAGEFTLYQNYPNPFNPTTKISWQLPVSSWQTLKVFNVLGNEVATLVNEYKPAGRYEVEFSASGGQESGNWNLASGIYFYQLKVYPPNGGAGSFVETKKMILLR